MRCERETYETRGRDWVSCPVSQSIPHSFCIFISFPQSIPSLFCIFIFLFLFFSSCISQSIQFLHFYLFSSIDALICLDFHFSAPLFLSICPSINAAFLFSIFFLNCLLINPKIMFGILSSFVSQPIPQIFFQLFLNQSRNFILHCFIFCQTVFLTLFLNQSVLFF